MRVVKLGGSLFASGFLLPCLNKLSHNLSGTPTVIVPGGGSFADEIRRAQAQWGFDDNAAHSMAILAMKQSALLINALKPQIGLFESANGFDRTFSDGLVALWSPDIEELNNAGIPASWRITSDSLSAWLARTLGADELILVKSVKIAHGAAVSELVQNQVVDAAFIEYTQQAAFNLTILHAENFLAEFR